jgi:hypothetical protein
MTCEAFTIPKGSDQLRFIYDARPANQYWTTEKFTLPDVFSPLSVKGEWYCKTDMSNAFMRWPIS